MPHTTLQLEGYTVTTITTQQDTIVQLAYQLEGKRGAHFDVLRDTRNGNLWAVNLRRSGYLPELLKGNLKAFEVPTKVAPWMDPTGRI